MTQPFKPFTKPPKKWLTKKLNDDTFLDYFYRLEELAINMFEWKNLPETVDERFLELTLCEQGKAIYFNDEVIGNVALQCMNGGPLDVYRIPIQRRAYSVNGYQKDLDPTNSVIIYNNRMHMPSINTIILFARRLYEIERTIDVNVMAQKTPVAILCDETQKLTMENLYDKYIGNKPVIIGTKNLDLASVSVLKTDAPYVSDKLNQLKRQIWNEALAFFGIRNSGQEKKERANAAEIEELSSSVVAQRYVMLNERRTAAKKINNMFGTNIEVNFRQDAEYSTTDLPLTTDETPEVGEDDGNLYN